MSKKHLLLEGRRQTPLCIVEVIVILVLVEEVLLEGILLCRVADIDDGDDAAHGQGHATAAATATGFLPTCILRQAILKYSVSYQLMDLG